MSQGPRFVQFMLNSRLFTIFSRLRTELGRYVLLSWAEIVAEIVAQHCYDFCAVEKFTLLHSEVKLIVQNATGCIEILPERAYKWIALR